MNKFARFVRTNRSALLGSGVLALAVPSFAAIDISAATTGITDASVAVLAVLAGMIVMAAAVYGVRKVLGLIGK